MGRSTNKVARDTALIEVKKDQKTVRVREPAERGKPVSQNCLKAGLQRKNSLSPLQRKGIREERELK